MQRAFFSSDRPAFRLLVAVGALITLTVSGTVGYRVVSDADWFDLVVIGERGSLEQLAIAASKPQSRSVPLSTEPDG